MTVRDYRIRSKPDEITAHSIAMTTTTAQDPRVQLQTSFSKGDTLAATKLLELGVDTPEIRAAVLRHQSGEPLRQAEEEWAKAPTYCFIRYNPDIIRYVDGREVYQGQPGYTEAHAEYKVAEAKWIEALTIATDERTARFVVHGHYVHHTTRKIILRLALLGYRPRLISEGSGKYTRLSETYGEYKYQDVVEVDALVNLDSSEPYQSGEQSELFGSSGSRNSWKTRSDGNGRTIDVTCWH